MESTFHLNRGKCFGRESVIRALFASHLKLTYSHFILRGFSICRESVIREKDFHTIWRWDELFASTFVVDIFSHDNAMLIASF